MRLAEGFELLATAPDGVARLRELTLSLAVRGKLVPQNPSDEPAGALLKEVHIEKDRLIAEGKIRRDKPLTEIADEEKPFALPDTWEWIRLHDLLPEFQNGASSRGDKNGTPTTVLRLADIRQGRINLEDTREISIAARDVDKYNLVAGDILAIRVNGSADLVGRFILNESNLSAIYCDHFIRIRVNGLWVLPAYLALIGDSQLVRSTISSLFITTAGQKTVNQGHIGSLIVPLPPLNEQRRIVAKVVELMSLCDELEARGRLESVQHARLTATLFDALAASESSHALAENWSRVAAHFDLLLDRTEAVDALERTVLELAVRGLLLPVDERNGTPSLSDETTTANSVEQADEATDDSLNVAPYDIPLSWSWIRFGEIMRDLRYGTSAKCDYEVEGTPVLRIPNLKNGGISTEDLKFGALTTQEVARLALVPGDLLLIRSNGSATLVGSAALVGEESRDFAFAGYLMRIRLREDVALPTYILLALKTEGVRAQIEGPIRTTSGVKNINSTEVSRLQFPLPPLETQRRIVDRVDDLRRLCADLRERLLARQTCQAHFAEALVEQAASSAFLAAKTDGLAAAA
ncbi:restriction endonuclease subunit S [Caballeronia novacaledonica]|uniref:restriction endonuclease subunit S n=1 Tax=Caballeronia novacaledonica TaxID=1544861 RepID=UPI001EE16847|nr:restriction endonuclease subunit S [Caballeronia novacaledonica]GJH13589.1 restriction endonuclease subunit S [Caballeronia novacaledonica]